MNTRSFWLITVLLFYLQASLSAPVEWDSPNTQKIISANVKHSKFGNQIKAVVEKKLKESYRFQNCGFEEHFIASKSNIVDYGTISHSTHAIVIEVTWTYQPVAPYNPKFYFPVHLTESEKPGAIIVENIENSTLQATVDGYDSVKDLIRYDVDKDYPAPVESMLSTFRNVGTHLAATHLRNFLEDSAGKLKILQELGVAIDGCEIIKQNLPELFELINVSHPAGYTYAIINHTKRHFLIYEGHMTLKDPQGDIFFYFVIAINEYTDTGKIQSAFEVLPIKPELHLREVRYTAEEVKTAMKDDMRKLYEQIVSGPYVEWKFPGCKIQADSVEENIVYEAGRMLKAELAQKSKPQHQDDKDEDQRNDSRKISVDLARVGRSFNIRDELFRNPAKCHAWKFALEQGEIRSIFLLCKGKMEKKKIVETTIKVWFPEKEIDMYTNISNVVSTAGTLLPSQAVASY